MRWFSLFIRFCARQHNNMLNAHMLSQFRLSFPLSITQVDQSKTVKVKIMRFSPYMVKIASVAPSLSSFCGASFIHAEILTGSPERGRQTRVGWGKQAIF